MDQRSINTAGEHLNRHNHSGKQFALSHKNEDTHYDPATQLERLPHKQQETHWRMFTEYFSS